MSRTVVGISEIRFAPSPGELVTYGLGSCVALVFHCPEAGLGAMAHIMLPFAHTPEEGVKTPGKFADTAVEAMVREMELRGIGPGGVVAKMAGGADMFAGRYLGTGRRIGARNVLAARRTLDDLGIPLLAQDVGGSVGRTVVLALGSGVLTVHTLRGGVKQL